MGEIRTVTESIADEVVCASALEALEIDPEDDDRDARLWILDELLEAERTGAAELVVTVASPKELPCSDGLRGVAVLARTVDEKGALALAMEDTDETL